MPLPMLEAVFKKCGWMEDLTSAFSVGAGGSGQRDQLWPVDTPGIVWRRFTNKSPHRVRVRTAPHCQDTTSFPPTGEWQAPLAIVGPIQGPSYSHFFPTKRFTEYTREGASHPRQ